MTKQELMKYYEEVKDKANKITLYIHMPGGEAEIISNPNVAGKIEYINRTYNDDLIHPACKDIYIISVDFDTYDSCLTFGTAVELITECGYKVARQGWNGKGMFLYYVPAANYPSSTKIAKECFGESVPYGAYIAMKTAQGNVVPWLASQTDVLARDWEIVL